MRRAFWAAATVLMFAGCSRQNLLVVANESNTQLRDVVASGSGFSEPLGAIAPHEKRRTAIRVRGESGLELHFNADGKDVSFGPDGYFEGTGGYLITATIGQDFSVSVKSELSPY